MYKKNGWLLNKKYLQKAPESDVAGDSMVCLVNTKCHTTFYKPLKVFWKYQHGSCPCLLVFFILWKRCQKLSEAINRRLIQSLITKLALMLSATIPRSCCYTKSGAWAGILESPVYWPYQNERHVTNPSPDS